MALSCSLQKVNRAIPAIRDCYISFQNSSESSDTELYLYHPLQGPKKNLGEKQRHIYIPGSMIIRAVFSPSELQDFFLLLFSGGLKERHAIEGSVIDAIWTLQDCFDHWKKISQTMSENNQCKQFFLTFSFV